MEREQMEIHAADHRVTVDELMVSLKKSDLKPRLVEPGVGDPGKQSRATV